ncbi:hypothetical protein C0J52_10775 [Blattella germanica]|nr:hypothetical protein C0J52_10775 [Blattella germanica]
MPKQEYKLGHVEKGLHRDVWRPMAENSTGLPSLHTNPLEPSVYRVRAPQVLANVTANLLMLDLCMAIGFTTVLIAAILHASQGLSISDTEASWLGSIAFICQPVGSIMSGLIVEFFGRKWSMIIVNVPFLVGWILYSVANSVTILYITNVILGIGVMIHVSFFVVYLMGNVTDWRTAAGISAAVPIITAIYVTQEDVHKDKDKGSGGYDNKAFEVDNPTPHSIQLPIGTDSQDTSGRIKVKQSRWKEMLKPPTLRPLGLVIPFFFLLQLGGMSSIRPFMVHVFQRLGLDEAASWATVGSAVVGIAGSGCQLLTVHWLGKRLLTLISMLGCAVSCLLLGIYCYMVLRPGGAIELAMPWLALLFFIALSFFNSVMFQIPWMLLSEIFPFRK